MNKEKIDDAILTLEVLIDCCKEDGTTYNAIKEWEALEVFKDLANRINKAIEYIDNAQTLDYGTTKEFNIKEFPFVQHILEILKGEDNDR